MTGVGGNVSRFASGALKLLFAGAGVTMLALAPLEHGPALISALERGIGAWQTEPDYESVEQMRGSVSQSAVADPEAFEGAQYLRTLRSWSGSTRQ